MHVADLLIAWGAARSMSEEAAAAAAGAAAWEGKGVVLYHVELVADVMVHTMTICHYIHVWWLHGGLPRGWGPQVGGCGAVDDPGLALG